MHCFVGLKTMVDNYLCCVNFNTLGFILLTFKIIIKLFCCFVVL